MNWIYDNEFNPEDYHSFVYLITSINTGRIYIGKKQFFSAVYKPLGKKELEARTDGRSSKKKLVVKESDWQNYWGSNKELKNDIHIMGEEFFTKKILHLCKTKKQATYYEVYYQMKYKVLHEEVDSYNENISGVYFKKDLIN
jgi:hypothetical protein